jgi:hypothetical protein
MNLRYDQLWILNGLSYVLYRFLERFIDTSSSSDFYCPFGLLVKHSELPMPQAAATTAIGTSRRELLEESFTRAGHESQRRVIRGLSSVQLAHDSPS